MQPIKCVCSNPGMCDRHKVYKDEELFNYCQTQNGFLHFEKMSNNIQEPGMVVKIINYGKHVAEHAMNGFKNVSEEIKNNRLEICNTCPLNVRGTCIDCGCVIAEKVLWETSSCPKGKWLATVETTRVCGSCGNK